MKKAAFVILLIPFFMLFANKDPTGNSLPREEHRLETQGKFTLIVTGFRHENSRILFFSAIEIGDIFPEEKKLFDMSRYWGRHGVDNTVFVPASKDKWRTTTYISPKNDEETHELLLGIWGDKNMLNKFRKTEEIDTENLPVKLGGKKDEIAFIVQFKTGVKIYLEPLSLKEGTETFHSLIELNQ